MELEDAAESSSRRSSRASSLRHELEMLASPSERDVAERDTSTNVPSSAAQSMETEVEDRSPAEMVDTERVDTESAKPSSFQNVSQTESQNQQENRFTAVDGNGKPAAAHAHCRRLRKTYDAMLARQKQIIQNILLGQANRILILRSLVWKTLQWCSACIYVIAVLGMLIAAGNETWKT